MEFIDVARNRYTTKKYDPSKKIPKAKIKELREILGLSPSSINSQPWRFILVESETVKSKLAGESYFNEQKINDASHLIVFSVIDDIEKFEEQIQQNLPEGAVGYYNDFIKILGEKGTKSWLKHQVYLSLGFFLSACASMGIDSSPMEGIKNDNYDKILKLNGYKALFAVAIGYRSLEDSNQPTVKPKSRLSLEKVIKTI